MQNALELHNSIKKNQNDVMFPFVCIIIVRNEFNLSLVTACAGNAEDTIQRI